MVEAGGSEVGWLEMERVEAAEYFQPCD